MVERHSEWKRVILSFNPYRLMTCFAIFQIARSDAAREASVAAGTTMDHQLLGNFIDEAALATKFYQTGIEKAANVIRSDDAPGYSTLDFLVEDIIEHLKVEPEVEDSSECLMAEDPQSQDHLKSMFDEAVRVLMPATEKIRNDVCRRHSRIFLQQLRRYKMWALQMYDSSAKLPSGVLSGNLNQLGDFDQCLSVSGDHVTGQYCLAGIDVAVADPSNTTESLKEAVEMMHSFGFIRSTVHDPGHFIPKFTTLNWAVCLPSSCPPEDLQEALTEVLTSMDVFTFTVRVEPQMCYSREVGSGHLDYKSIAAMCGFGLIVGVAIIATVRDTEETKKLSNRAGKLERIIMAFSFKRNWASLVAEVPNEGDIHCIHGVRAVCTLMLYVAHKLIPVSMSPFFNRNTLTEFSNEPLSIILRASLIYTDSFLLLSGVLTAYNLGKEMQKTGKIAWGKRYFARFIRLTPALAALVIFYAYIFEHLGSGPLWGRVVQDNADICKRGWWTNILYIQNFFPFENMCATQTHQLALDMQLTLLSFLLVYLLYKHQVAAALFIVLLQAALAALRYYVTLGNDLSLIIYHGMPVSQLYRTANLSYSLSPHRATPYIVGVVVGYLLQRYEKSYNIPKPAVILGWVTAGLCCYLSVFSYTHVAQREFPYDRVEAASYSAFSPIMWSIALGWTICACALGQGGALNRFLSWRGLVLLSRISYSMYLTQFLVFFYNVGTLRAAQVFQLSHSVSLEEFFVVVLVSIAVTLLFDLPMQDVKAILTGSGPRNKTCEKVHVK